MIIFLLEPKTYIIFLPQNTIPLSVCCVPLKLFKFLLRDAFSMKILRIQFQAVVSVLIP